MEIDPRTNGLHSLAKALEAFKQFHENPKDIFAVKDSILRSHHALETLFKHVLYTLSPTLLVHEDTKVKKVLEGFVKWKKGENASVVDDLRTINLEDTIIRLEQFDILSLSPKEYGVFLDSVKKLQNFRNRIQHFALSARPQVVARILGNVLPRATDALDKIFSSPPLGIRDRFYVGENIHTQLEKLFPEAPEILDLLRNEYDQLIRQAIEFFEGREFVDQSLKLTIKDYGKVGPPPYHAELNSSGFLECQFDISSRLDFMRRGFFDEKSPYRANVTIGQPEIIERVGSADVGAVEGSLELEAQITFERPNECLLLPEADEHTGTLREFTATLKANLTYKAEALLMGAHYHVERILEAHGRLDVRLTALPRGYEAREVELIGFYQSEIDKDSAPFDLHAFREPDGSLSDNHHLVWNINTTGNLTFRRITRA